MKLKSGMGLAILAAGAAFGLVVLTLFSSRSLTKTLAPLPIDQGIVSKSGAETVKPSRGGVGKHHRTTDRYIVVNTHANRVYYRTKDKVLLEAVCSTGSGDTLLDSATGRLWVFNTPRGQFEVTSKLVEPWWRKPDWAYLAEDSTPPPASKESERLDPEMMGAFAMGFGDGFFIHGTLYERLLGVNVTHGCVRLGAEDLKALYSQVTIGTTVYVF